MSLLLAKDQVTRYWSLLDASIIHLKNVDTFTSVIPSKIFESISMGIPLLHGVKGESAELVKTHQVGLTFPSEDPESLCKCIRKLHDDKALRDNLTSNCISSSKKFDRKVKAQEMLEILCRLIGKPDQNILTMIRGRHS